ncbi:MAG: IPT/TIG domain-containing protein, partial [Candidatus Marinimicrobia bacterium]|nr:IPT/TIG domain-containing protein [Candidatus Neomarinimicrobiota bacterium]
MRVIFQTIIIFFVISSCEKYPSVDTVWPPYENSTAAPIITSVSPHADSAFGGFTILTISGENFSSDSGGNFIYIGGEKVSPASES